MIVRNYDALLVPAYGDYMQLPKEEDRRPIHTVERIDFGEDK